MSHFLGSLTLVSVLKVKEAVTALLFAVATDNLQMFQKFLIGRIAVSCYDTTIG